MERSTIFSWENTHETSIGPCSVAMLVITKGCNGGFLSHGDFRVSTAFGHHILPSAKAGTAWMGRVLPAQKDLMNTVLDTVSRSRLMKYVLSGD